MDVAPIVARLQAQLAGKGYVQIGGAAELDAAIEAVPNVPCAFTLPLAEAGGEVYLAGQYAQRIDQAFAVVLVVSNLRDPKGAAAAVELQSRRLQVRNALCGWSPAADGEMCVFSSGRLLRFEQGRMWWTDEFRVTSDFRLVAV